MCFDPQKIVKTSIAYYTQLLDVQVCIDDNVKMDRYEFFNGVRNHVSHDVAQSLDVDIPEDEVEHVMSHLDNDKSPRWDGLTNGLFKKYLVKLNEHFTILFQKVDIRGNASFLKDCFVKSFVEGAFFIFHYSMEAYSLCYILILNAKVMASRLQRFYLLVFMMFNMCSSQKEILCIIF